MFHNNPSTKVISPPRLFKFSLKQKGDLKGYIKVDYFRIGRKGQIGKGELISWVRGTLTLT